MPRWTNPLTVGDNASGIHSTTVSADVTNPVALSFVRIPVTGQAVTQYKLPSYAVVLDAWLDVTTAWGTGNINLGTTSSGAELATALGTATGRVRPTITGAQVTAGKAATLGAGQVTVFAGNAASTGAGVGEVVVLIGYANFARAD